MKRQRCSQRSHRKKRVKYVPIERRKRRKRTGIHVWMKRRHGQTLPVKEEKGLYVGL